MLTSQSSLNRKITCNNDSVQTFEEPSMETQ